MKYAVVIEKGRRQLLNTFLTCGLWPLGQLSKTEIEIRDAISFHLEGMREDGIPFPEPTSRVEYIESAA
jgi:hypothetical protein